MAVSLYFRDNAAPEHGLSFVRTRLPVLKGNADPDFFIVFLHPVFRIRVLQFTETGFIQHQEKRMALQHTGISGNPFKKFLHIRAVDEYFFHAVQCKAVSFKTQVMIYHLTSCRPVLFRIPSGDTAAAFRKNAAAVQTRPPRRDVSRKSLKKQVTAAVARRNSFALNRCKPRCKNAGRRIIVKSRHNKVPWNGITVFLRFGHKSQCNIVICAKESIRFFQDSFRLSLAVSFKTAFIRPLKIADTVIFRKNARRSAGAAKSAVALRIFVIKCRTADVINLFTAVFPDQMFRQVIKRLIIIDAGEKHPRNVIFQGNRQLPALHNHIRQVFPFLFGIDIARYHNKTVVILRLYQ